MSASRNYIDITPASLAVHCVERAAQEVQDATCGTPVRWWFAILDIDQALTAALVEVLTGTAGIGALTKKLQIEWLNYYDEGGQAPKETRLAPFEDLLNRAQDIANCHSMHGTLSLSVKDKKDILRLHEFRNNLLHVKPMSWSLEITGLPRMMGAVTTALKQLFEMNPLNLHLEEHEAHRASDAINRILKLIDL